MTHTDEAKKLVADALPCDCVRRGYHLQHANDCPAYYRPAVESLVTRLLAQLSELEGIDKVCDHTQETVVKMQADYDALLADNERLRESSKIALEHVLELEEAWQRGCISEHDGLGGTRSNRNVDVKRVLYAAIENRGRP